MVKTSAGIKAKFSIIKITTSLDALYHHAVSLKSLFYVQKPKVFVHKKGNPSILRIDPLAFIEG
jgi:hypothetical protein